MRRWRASHSQQGGAGDGAAEDEGEEEGKDEGEPDGDGDPREGDHAPGPAHRLVEETVETGVALAAPLRGRNARRRGSPTACPRRDQVSSAS